MSESVTLEKAAKAKSTHPNPSKSAYEIPDFKIPNLEMPPALRELVAKGGAQAKENCEKIRTATEAMSGVVETTFANAAKGATDCGLKVLEANRANTMAAIEFIGKLVSVTSPSEAVELATAHVREQFEASFRLNKEFLTLVEKIAAEAAEPIKTSLSKALTPNG